MRALGCAMIAAACLLYCLEYARAQSARLRELSSVAAMLMLMESELAARLTPLPELVSLLEPVASEPAKAFLALLTESLDRLGEESFGSIWSDCVRRAFRELKEDERAELERLGASLGRYDIGSQLHAVRQCAEALSRSEERCRSELPDRRKLHMGLACTGAALLVIVLL